MLLCTLYFSNTSLYFCCSSKPNGSKRRTPNTHCSVFLSERSRALLPVKTFCSCRWLSLNLVFLVGATAAAFSSSPTVQPNESCLRYFSSITTSSIATMYCCTSYFGICNTPSITCTSIHLSFNYSYFQQKCSLSCMGNSWKIQNSLRQYLTKHGTSLAQHNIWYCCTSVHAQSIPQHQSCSCSTGKPLSTAMVCVCIFDAARSQVPSLHALGFTLYSYHNRTQQGRVCYGCRFFFLFVCLSNNKHGGCTRRYPAHTTESTLIFLLFRTHQGLACCSITAVFFFEISLLVCLFVLQKQRQQ